MKNLANQAMGRGLKLLADVGGAPWLDKLGWRSQATQLVEKGSRVGFRAAQQLGAQAKARFKPGQAAAEASRLPSAGERARVFDLNFTEEQQLTQETMRRFSETVIQPIAREADDQLFTPQAVFDEAQELGLALLALPEALGGAGAERSAVNNSLIIEALAQGDMGVALALLSPLSVVQLLVDAGSAAQQARYLTPLAGDEFVGAALAVMEPSPLFDPYRLTTRAERRGQGWELSGVKTMVPLGNKAELLLVAAATPSGEPKLFIVPRGTPGCTWEPEPAMGLRAAELSRVKLEQVQLPTEALLGEGQTDWRYAELVDRARVGWAAMAVGAGQAVLDYVIPYCNERVAFGEPITNRQSVAFMIADIALELDGMRLLMQRAASRADQGLSFSREAFLAKVQAADYGMKIGSDGVQLLGGHGFVKEHPVELWYRNLRAISLMEGALYV